MEVSIEKVVKTEYGELLNVLLNKEFIINGCKIVNYNGGQFVAMPNRKGKDGKYYDHCRFKDRAKQDEFSHLVISAYEGNSGSMDAKEEPKPKNEDVSWEE